VTVFLIITGLMNIALGYGLAMYLGGAHLPGRAPQGDDFDNLHSDVPLAEVTLTTISAAPAESAEPAASAAAVAATPTAPPAATSASHPAGAASTAAGVEPATPAAAMPAAGAELEQEVLAGIEEFRNQLAQMKSQPTGAAPEPASVTA
jgi:hypothetical protein